MFAIVKTAEGWTVRDEEFGVVIDTYARLLDAQARITQIAENTAIVESFSPSGAFVDDPDFDSMVSGDSGFYVHS